MRVQHGLTRQHTFRTVLCSNSSQGFPEVPGCSPDLPSDTFKRPYRSSAPGMVHFRIENYPFRTVLGSSSSQGFPEAPRASRTSPQIPYKGRIAPQLPEWSIPELKTIHFGPFCAPAAPKASRKPERVFQAPVALEAIANRVSCGKAAFWSTCDLGAAGVARSSHSSSETQ